MRILVRARRDVDAEDEHVMQIILTERQAKMMINQIGEEAMCGAAKRAWNVTGQAFDRKTGAPEGKQRVERVDTGNSLFEKCKTAFDVHEAYEAFWNEMNGSSKHVVFVQKVEETE